MVGLPARGKSYIAKKIVGYFNWRGLRTRLFNVGNRRRELLDGSLQQADYFSAQNTSAAEQREKIARDVLESLFAWLAKDNHAAVFDATNTTRTRRAAIQRRAAEFSPLLNVLFLESICDDPKVLHANFCAKVANSPDYNSQPQDEAMSDLKKRIAAYEAVYETITEDELCYVKLINLQSKVICNNVRGALMFLAVNYLMSIHTRSRPIWLSRPGRCSLGTYDIDTLRESDGRILDSSTAEAPLTDSGNEYAVNLGQYITRQCRDQGHDISDLVVYTSTIPRAVDTVKHLPVMSQQLSTLNPLDTGVCHGMTIEEMRTKMPAEFEAWQQNPFLYRPPGGEAFADLVKRLEPLVIELERQTKPVLVVAHRSTLQVLYGYFIGKHQEDCLEVSVPHDEVVELVPDLYGWRERHARLYGPPMQEAVSFSRDDRFHDGAFASPPVHESFITRPREERLYFSPDGADSGGRGVSVRRKRAPTGETDLADLVSADSLSPPASSCASSRDTSPDPRAATLGVSPGAFVRSPTRRGPPPPARSSLAAEVKVFAESADEIPMHVAAAPVPPARRKPVSPLAAVSSPIKVPKTPPPVHPESELREVGGRSVPSPSRGRSAGRVITPTSEDDTSDDGSASAASVT